MKKWEGVERNWVGKGQTDRQTDTERERERERWLQLSQANPVSNSVQEKTKQEKISNNTENDSAELVMHSANQPCYFSRNESWTSCLALRKNSPGQQTSPSSADANPTPDPSPLSPKTNCLPQCTLWPHSTCQMKGILINREKDLVRFLCTAILDDDNQDNDGSPSFSLLTYIIFRIFVSQTLLNQVNVPETCKEYLMNRIALAISCAAVLEQKLHTKVGIFCSHQ